MVYTVNCKLCKRPNYIKTNSMKMETESVLCVHCPHNIGSFQRCQIEGHQSDIMFVKEGNKYNHCKDCVLASKIQHKRDKNRERREKKQETLIKKKEEQVRLQNRTPEQQIKEYILKGIDVNDIKSKFSTDTLAKVRYSVHYTEDSNYFPLQDGHDSDKHDGHDVDAYYEIDVYFPLLEDFADDELFNKYYDIDDIAGSCPYSYDYTYSFNMLDFECVPNTGQYLRLYLNNVYGE